MIGNSDTFKQLTSTDYFFFYGEGLNDYRNECKHDVFEIVIQPQRSMPFFRSYGAGIHLNFPLGLMQRIMVPFSITNSLAYRNLYVSDGSNGTNDMRVATSQEAISFDADDNGNVDISVFYFMYADLSTQLPLRIPVPGGW